MTVFAIEGTDSSIQLTSPARIVATTVRP